LNLKCRPLRQRRNDELGIPFANRLVAHRDAVGSFQTAADGASDPQVKTFAQTKLPALREHLKMAQALAKEVGASAASKSDPPARSQ
jgi:putative membrane protein